MIEVASDIETENLANTDSHIRITIEIGVDLHRIKQSPDQKRRSGLARIIGPYAVCHKGKMISNTNLREHTPKNLPTTIYGLDIVQRVRPSQLRNKCVRTVNRTGKECGKKCNVCCKLYKILTGFNMLTMNLDDVTDQLKREEADTYRQDNMKSGPRCLKTYCTQQFRKRLGKEIQVLEIQQQSDTKANSQRCQP